jgi:hypothetical protein
MPEGYEIREGVTPRGSGLVRFRDDALRWTRTDLVPLIARRFEAGASEAAIVDELVRDHIPVGVPVSTVVDLVAEVASLRIPHDVRLCDMPMPRSGPAPAIAPGQRWAWPHGHGATVVAIGHEGTVVSIDRHEDPTLDIVVLSTPGGLDRVGRLYLETHGRYRGTIPTAWDVLIGDDAL